jgi:hypothetical protein
MAKERRQKKAAWAGNRQLLVGSSIGSGQEREGQRQKKAAWAGNRQCLVNSSIRKWTGKRRPKKEGRKRQPGQAIGSC